MIWKQWLVPVKPQVKYTKMQHFEYMEDVRERRNVKAPLAKLVHSYHTKSSVGISLLPILGFPLVARTMLGDNRPTASDVRKGNLVEILACEFAHVVLGYHVPVHRLHYNTNPNQSMKGDDILGFRFAEARNEVHSVLVGEAKYRGQYGSQVVTEGYNALQKGFRPYPASVEFVATVLDMRGDRAKAQQVRQVRSLLASASRSVERAYCLFLATEGRPQKPFAVIQEMDVVLDNLVVVNVSFESGIDLWIDQVYEEEVSL